jgi:molecular chaperone GrpE
MSDDVEKKVEEGEAAATEAGEATQAAEPEEPNLEEQLAKAKAQADEYLDNWRRAVADLANYRKRTEREREEASRFSNALLLGKLLPVLDDFDRAMAAVPADLRHLTWVDGVALIERKLRLILEAEGLKPIEAMGKPFDPEWHEAILREETTDYPDGQVIAELQRGYELHGRILRPTLVKVAVAPKTEEETEGIGGTEGTEEGIDPTLGRDERGNEG